MIGLTHREAGRSAKNAVLSLTLPSSLHRDAAPCRILDNKHCEPSLWICSTTVDILSHGTFDSVVRPVTRWPGAISYGFDGPKSVVFSENRPLRGVHLIESSESSSGDERLAALTATIH